MVQTTQGSKHDGGKLRYDLVPVMALEEVVKVITLGAEKYDPENWKNVPEGRRRYYAAAMRHMEAWRKGEKKDEIGTHHIANAISNLMFILEKELRGWEDVEEQGEMVVKGSSIKSNPESPWYPCSLGKWIEYNGSGQPVEDDVVVDVLLYSERDSQRWWPTASRASTWDWNTDLGDDKIVAYKIVK